MATPRKQAAPPEPDGSAISSDPDLPAETPTDPPEPTTPPTVPDPKPTVTVKDETSGPKSDASLVAIQDQVNALGDELHKLTETLASAPGEVAGDVEAAVARALASKEHAAEHERMRTEHPEPRKRTGLAALFLGD